MCLAATLACSAACQLISGVDDLTVRQAPAATDASSDGAGVDGAGGDGAAEAATDGGKEATPPAETGSDSGAESTVDASLDATDGPRDAAPETTDAHYCQTLSPTPQYCVDFDEGFGASSYWTSLSGSAALTSARAASPPSSMLCSNSTPGGGAWGDQDFSSGNPGTYTLAFDIQLVSGDTSSAADNYIGEVDFGLWSIDIELTAVPGRPGQYAVFLAERPLQDAGGGLLEDSTSGTLSVGPGNSAGPWTHVVLVLDTAGDGGADQTGSLSIDGTNVGTVPLHSVPSAAASIQAGLLWEMNSSSTGWVVAVDNVTFDWH